METSNAEIELRRTLTDIFDQWDDLFDFTIEHDTEDSYRDYFFVEIHVKESFVKDKKYVLCAAVSSEDVEFDMSEDCWYELNRENIFTWMWFVEAARNDE